MATLHDYDKILTRLVIILQRLYEGKSLLPDDLAKEFNVSRRTIQRDFNQRLNKFPIERNGRKWCMQKGYKITKERTPEEILVIDMLENIAQSIGAGFGSKAKHLFSKLQNHSNNPIYSKTIIEDISESLELFHKVEKAIRNNLIIQFTYNKKVRRVKPYKIVSFEGYWYLYGEEILKNSLKTFYFKDITLVETTNEAFIPESHAYTILERSINAWFEPNSEYFEVILNASANIAKYFERRPISTTQRITKIYNDGSMDIALLSTSDREILHEIKKWIPDLIIVSPKELALKAKNNANKFLSKQVEYI